MDEPLRRDLVIIGAGPGGYVAALDAAKKGLKVTLIERRFIGGTCLNVGCIPTKALVQASDVYRESLESSRFGIHTENVGVDFTKVRQYQEQTVKTLVDGISFLLSKAGVEVVAGTASFSGPHLLTVQTESGPIAIDAANIILATGAKTRPLAVPGADLPGILDSEGLLALDRLPASLTVVGGGIIGMEFAFAFARFGVRVTVLEMLPEILPMVDREAVGKLLRSARQLRMVVETGITLRRFESTETGVAVVFEKNGVETSLDSACVLKAVGRVPDLEGLHLEQAGVALGTGRGIPVDVRMRTSVPWIHAIGDLTNILQLAHVASRQAVVAVDDILGRTTTMDYRFIPNVLYTTPAVAWVGLSEADALAQGITIRTTRSPYAANGRALIHGQAVGFVKLVASAVDGKLLGATIFGAAADELIAAITLALNAEMSATSVAASVIAHPTVAETIHEAAAGVLGEALHYLE